MGDFSQTAVTQFTIDFEGSERCPHPERLDHNTGDYVPYSYRTVSGFFNVPYYLISNKDYETGPPVYSPYPRRLESLTICRCNYKGSTFSSVILRPWVLVRPESNSRPPAWQPDAQPTEPPVRLRKGHFVTCATREDVRYISTLENTSRSAKVPWGHAKWIHSTRIEYLKYTICCNLNTRSNMHPIVKITICYLPAGRSV